MCIVYPTVFYIEKKKKKKWINKKYTKDDYDKFINLFKETIHIELRKIDAILAQYQVFIDYIILYIVTKNHH